MSTCVDGDEHASRGGPDEHVVADADVDEVGARAVEHPDGSLVVAQVVVEHVDPAALEHPDALLAAAGDDVVDGDDVGREFDLDAGAHAVQDHVAGDDRIADVEVGPDARSVVAANVVAPDLEPLTLGDLEAAGRVPGVDVLAVVVVDHAVADDQVRGEMSVDAEVPVGEGVDALLESQEAGRGRLRLIAQPRLHPRLQLTKSAKEKGDVKLLSCRLL